MPDTGAVIEDLRVEPDATLVAGIRAGDARAFETLMRRYNRRLYRIAFGVLADPAEAEDVVQEAYVRAYTRLGDLADPAKVASWLARIAANDAYDRVRRMRHVQPLETMAGTDDVEGSTLPMEIQSTEIPDPERAAASVQMRPLLEDAIANLPEEFRAVFVLRAVEQMSVAEIADCLGLRTATVKTRFHRARRRLRKALSDQVSVGWPSTFQFAGGRCDRVVATVLARTGFGDPAGA